MKRAVCLASAFALFTLFVQFPAILLAQGEVTIDDAKTNIGDLVAIESLVQAVAELTERVRTLEDKFAPFTTSDVVCVQYAQWQLQRETRTKNLEVFGENIGEIVTLQAIHHDSRIGITVYYFVEGFDGRSVTEKWRGCQFLNVGAWVVRSFECQT